MQPFKQYNTTFKYKYSKIEIKHAIQEKYYLFMRKLIGYIQGGLLPTIGSVVPFSQ